MSKIDTAILWGPDPVGRSKLDERWWAYVVEAPFDMPADIPDLIGRKVSLDGQHFEIRGIVPAVPVSPISKGDFMELLVRAA